MTLRDLIEAVKEGQHPDPEELRYAVLALDAMCVFDMIDMVEIYEGAEVKPQVQRAFDRAKSWSDLPARKIVGWENDPTNPEYQDRRKLSEMIVRGSLH